MARAARTEDQDEGVRSFDARQTLDFPTQNAFLKLNLAAIFSLQPLALSLSPQSRSACSAYSYEKIRNRVALGKDSAFRSKPLVVRFSEIPLRFAETSQQTLRHFLLLPTTYINFAETTIREANNSYWAPDLWRAGAANFAYSVVQRIDRPSPDFPTQNAFLGS
jgi:hypothetical protein